MRVKVEEIQAKGLSLSEPLKAALLEEALADSEGFSLVKPGNLKVQFQRISGTVHLAGHFDVELSAPCKRCTTPVPAPQKIEFELRMVEKAQRPHGEASEGEDDGGSERAGTFTFDDVDAEPFDGKTIELDPVVREQLLLSLPSGVLCREDCKGLCTVCGQDLNEKECGCDRKGVDVRLAALKNIKL